MIQEFSSKVDTWLFLILILTTLVSLIGAFILIIRRGGIIGYLSGILLLSICGVFPAWFLIDTNYTVANDTLVIKSGPRIWVVPISSISSVVETRDSRSSPALSLDRLRIRYDGGKIVLISPRDKQGFLQAIDYTL